MPKVFITKTLFKELEKKFKKEELRKITSTLFSLESQPKKGKLLGTVGGIVIKEIKHEKYRFYCITDGHLLKFTKEEDLASLVIKFVKMSEKKDQQKAIDEIKDILMSMGFEGF